MQDKVRVGRPVCEATESAIAAVSGAVSSDARMTVDDIAGLTGLSAPTVFKIWKGKLRLHQVCATWFPDILTPEQKRTRVDHARLLLKKYRNCSQRLLKEIFYRR